MAATPSIEMAAPRHIASRDDCLFYHSIDLPEGTVAGTWDLRPTIRDYLGRYDVAGKRVLDVGAAGGFLTFWMEGQRAEVVSFDMTSGAEWDVVPYWHERYDLAAQRAAFMEADRRTKNAYWYAHERLGSRSRAYYGDIRAISPDLGPFHTVVLGMILPHLRDPFAALAAVAPLAQETIIVTQPAPHLYGPQASFLPTPALREPTDAWWAMSVTCIQRMLSVVGFEVDRVVRATHRRTDEGRDEECAALVAHRRAYGADPAPIESREPIEALKRELEAIHATKGWRMLTTWWRLKAKLTGG